MKLEIIFDHRYSGTFAAV